jgi:hypothetical protein
MSDDQTIGKRWLENYRNGFLNHDAKLCASIFHPGFTYIVNGNPRSGAGNLCKPETFEFFFKKIEFLRVDVYNVFEVHPGHLFHTFVLRNRNRATSQEQEAYFIDECVVNAEGKVMLINRVAPQEFYDNLEKWLSS